MVGQGRPGWQAGEGTCHTGAGTGFEREVVGSTPDPGQ